MLTHLVLAATLAIQARAASPSQRPRTLQEVIDLTMQEGQEYPMQAGKAPQLGLPARELPLRRLRYKQSACPDRKEHTFSVLYERDEKGAERPFHLLVTVGSGKKENGVVTIDATSFLLAPDGTIRRAVHDHGPVDELKTDQLKLSGRIRKQASAELTFHTKVAFALNLRPVK